MYAIEAAVKNLCRNKKSTLTLAEIEAAALLVDAEIDAALSQRHYWPNDSDGNAITPPQLVVNMATVMTAAIIEMQAFAQNEAGQNVPNPYGKTLENRGKEWLKGLVAGTVSVPQLERAPQVASRHMDTIHSPVTALRTSGGRK